MDADIMDEKKSDLVIIQHRDSEVQDQKGGSCIITESSSSSSSSMELKDLYNGIGFKSSSGRKKKKQAAAAGAAGDDIVQAVWAASLTFAASYMLSLQQQQQQQHQQQIKGNSTDQSSSRFIPKMVMSMDGRVLIKLESFSHYVGKQWGVHGELLDKLPHFCKLTHDYLRGAKKWEDNILSFFSAAAADQLEDADSLHHLFVNELDICTLSYFAYHWGQASAMIRQALSHDAIPKAKLKTLVMAATRSRRVEQATKELKVKRVFSTLVEEMKIIHPGLASGQIMAPLDHADRSPVLLLMGGGMGAGKSTIRKKILKEPFWQAASEKAVVVDSDAFKESDVIFRALSTNDDTDLIQTAELVHQSSINAAASLLVTALNEGRDIIMDGTLSWHPFVEQTIAMVRNIHQKRYRMGIGYKVSDDGTITENYWEEVGGNEEDEKEVYGNVNHRKPYRIELVGVVCDAHLAVVRGIRRAMQIGRAVRVKSQLKSHKSFACVFETYCALVDHARLYCTNSMGGPELIGQKDGQNALLVNPKSIDCLERLKTLNEDAESVDELYPKSDVGAGWIWKDVIGNPSRANHQKQLMEAVIKIEELLHEKDEPKIVAL